MVIEEVAEIDVGCIDSKLTSTPKNGFGRYASTVKLDWSDNETLSDLSETRSSRHLDSPKKKVQRSNHYTVCQSPYKVFI